MFSLSKSLRKWDAQSWSPGSDVVRTEDSRSIIYSVLESNFYCFRTRTDFSTLLWLFQQLRCPKILLYSTRTHRSLLLNLHQVKSSPPCTYGIDFLETSVQDFPSIPVKFRLLTFSPSFQPARYFGSWFCSPTYQLALLHLCHSLIWKTRLLGSTPKPDKLLNGQTAYHVASPAR